jgi:hypothetical protein
MYGSGYNGPTFSVDGVQKIGQTFWNDGDTFYGILTASELLPDVTHTIVADSYYGGYGVLAITYRVP